MAMLHCLHMAVGVFFLDKCASFWLGSRDRSQTKLKVAVLLPDHNTTLTTISSAKVFSLKHVCWPLTACGCSLGIRLVVKLFM